MVVGFNARISPSCDGLDYNSTNAQKVGMLVSAYSSLCLSIFHVTLGGGGGGGLHLHCYCYCDNWLVASLFGHTIWNSGNGINSICRSVLSVVVLTSNIPLHVLYTYMCLTWDGYHTTAGG